MEIVCKNCGHVEETNKDFFVKLIGGAMPVGGYWAWTTYLFAGTGFAMVIVLAIIGGGVAMLLYKDEITEWIISQGYKCSKCGKVSWEPMTKDIIKDRQSPKYTMKLTRALIEMTWTMKQLSKNKPAMINDEFDEEYGSKDHEGHWESNVDVNLQAIRSSGYDIEPVGDVWLIEVARGELVEIESAEMLEEVADMIR